MTDDALRPGFADELLARLERSGRRRPWRDAAKVAAAVALPSSLLVLASVRRRAR